MRKHNFRLNLFSVIIVLLVSAFISGCSSGDHNTIASEDNAYPTNKMNGTIAWGAGGATDNVARSFSPLLEKHLGQSIVMTNKPGATGAVATQSVYKEASDGYNLLFGSESAGLFGLMDISELGLNDFYPVSIVGGQILTLAVSKDAEWDTLEEFIEYAKNHPGEVKMGSPGVGTAPEVIHFMKSLL